MAATSAAEGLPRVLALYRAVLRIHRERLPPPLRDLGDSYARAEFQRHLRGRTTPPQWREFAEQWQTYTSMLRGTADLEDRSGHLPEDLVEAMTPEQQQQLAQLKEAMEELGRGMLAGRAAPDGGEQRR